MKIGVLNLEEVEQALGRKFSEFEGMSDSFAWNSKDADGNAIWARVTPRDEDRVDFYVSELPKGQKSIDVIHFSGVIDREAGILSLEYDSDDPTTSDELMSNFLSYVILEAA